MPRSKAPYDLRRKYKFYRQWFFDMTSEEQNSFVGRWVLERCNVYCTLIEQSQDAILKNLGCGNYKFSGS